MNEGINYLAGILMLGGLLLTILFWSLFIMTPYAKHPESALKAAIPFTSMVFVSPLIMTAGTALYMVNAVLRALQL